MNKSNKSGKDNKVPKENNTPKENNPAKDINNANDSGISKQQEPETIPKDIKKENGDLNQLFNVTETDLGIGDISIPEYTEQNQYQQQQPKPKPILKKEKKSSSNIKKPNAKFSIQDLDDFNLDYSSKEREKPNGDGGGGGGSFKNDLGNTDNAPKGWDDDFEKICANLIDESQINTFLHQKSNRYYTKWSRRFQIPIIIMSAIAGSGNFMSSSFGQYERLAIIIIGVISIFTSILSSIAQYLQLAELKESHRISSFHWENFFNELKVQLMLKRESRKDLPEFYHKLFIEYRRLKEISPIFKKKITKSIKKKDGYEYMNVPFYLNGFRPIVPYEKSLEDYNYYYMINNSDKWFHSGINKNSTQNKNKNNQNNKRGNTSNQNYNNYNNQNNQNNNNNNMNNNNGSSNNIERFKTIRGRPNDILDIDMQNETPDPDPNLAESSFWGTNKKTTSIV